MKLTVTYALYDPDKTEHDVYTVEVEHPGQKPDPTEVAPLLSCMFGAIDEACTADGDDDEDGEGWKKEGA